jgi:glycosyltransferase involved in cell wall biosynthesis
LFIINVGELAARSFLQPRGAFVRIYYFEPDLHGHRKAYLEGFRKYSRHEIVTFPLPERRKNQPRRLNILPFLEKVSHQQTQALGKVRSDEVAADRVGALITTDPLSLCDFYGLGRQWFAGIPSVIIFHELMFSRSLQQRQTYQQETFSLLYSLLAADRLLFTSANHKEACFDSLPPVLQQLPEFPGRNRVLEILEKKARILHPGIPLRELDLASHNQVKYKSPTILWNQRWEPNKQPELFLQTLYRLAGEGMDFGVILCGSRPAENGSGEAGSVESLFEEARMRLGSRVFHCGFVRSRAEYANLLWSSDIVISTAEVDYFPNAIIEAAYCDCYPLTPDRLDYPSLYPLDQKDRFIYRDTEDLYSRLKILLMDPLEIGSAALHESMLKFDWERAVKEHDREFATLVPSYRSDVLEY